MRRKMSKAEKTARHLPLEEDYWIDTDYYAYSSERKINLKTGKEAGSRNTQKTKIWKLMV